MTAQEYAAQHPGFVVPKLKPCPFCGGEATMIFEEKGSHQWIVLCKNHECAAQPMTVYKITEGIAAKTWNDRKNYTV